TPKPTTEPGPVGPDADRPARLAAPPRRRPSGASPARPDASRPASLAGPPQRQPPGASPARPDPGWRMRAPGGEIARADAHTPLPARRLRHPATSTGPQHPAPGHAAPGTRPPAPGTPHPAPRPRHPGSRRAAHRYSGNCAPVQYAPITISAVAASTATSSAVTLR